MPYLTFKQGRLCVGLDLGGETSHGYEAYAPIVSSFDAVEGGEHKAALSNVFVSYASGYPLQGVEYTPPLDVVGYATALKQLYHLHGDSILDKFPFIEEA